MKEMSKEMLEKATHIKSTDELKAMMTMSATALDDSELDTVTGGADIGSKPKIRHGTHVWFIHKYITGELIYDAGVVYIAYRKEKAYFVERSEYSVSNSRLPLRILDSEIYLYSNDL